MRPACALALLLPLASAAHATDAPAQPNPILTPGAIDPAATLDVICNSTTRDRRHVSAAEKSAALDAYSIPRAQAPYYEFDHLIPLAIGGANTIANLWPQPWAEADEKDVLEVELQRLVCHGVLSQAEAQRAIADDWTEAYRRYVGRVPVAATGYDETLPAVPAARSTFRACIEAAGLRLARRCLTSASRAGPWPRSCLDLITGRKSYSTQRLNQRCAEEW